MRKMLNLSGERTLIAAIIPPGVCHIDGIYSMTFTSGFVVMAGCMASLPYDFYIKVSGKANGCYNIFSSFPILNNSIYAGEIAVRALLLNCVTREYSELWEKSWISTFTQMAWTKDDARLLQDKFSRLTRTWNYDTPLRTDFERRQALVELDVLVAMALGMTFEQLVAVYRIQFPVLQQNEEDTWFDAFGRIAFTKNKGLSGVGYDRKVWESELKESPEGKKFYRTITDDTMPGGPVERTIEYVAPFDRCDREQDYETAWKFFEEKYGKR